MPTNDSNQQQSAPFSLSLLPDGGVKLSFLTLNPSWKNTYLSNLPAKVSYQFASDSDSGRKVLTRIEQLFSGEKAIAAEQKEFVVEGFLGIALYAADPNAGSLSDSWKNELQCSQSPPKAVKILLKWPKDEQTTFEFETIIKVICQEQINQP